MAWSIWKCWNGWIFDNLPPTVEGSRAFLRKELIHLLLRIKTGGFRKSCIMDAICPIVIVAASGLIDVVESVSLIIIFNKIQ
jgi:hypothetical protein